ncbi:MULTISPECIES: DUF3784 domain-containing protein [unclassified Lysinibacillus]|uniref:DUF3784 domain-containing protein n=1 Tax=unclassified Lysinibacillus TaxID=2636778 RepID=UPI00381535D6
MINHYDSIFNICNCFIAWQWCMLIAGFNTLAQSEKETYNKKALAKFIGKIMYGYCFCILLLALDGVFQTEWLLIVSLVQFIGLTVFTLIIANTANRIIT